LYNEIGAYQLNRAFGNMPKALVILIALLLTYMAASISYFAVEKPFLRMRARIESRYRSARTVAAKPASR
jgi:peptidoglycan/LPS O-acetylase OafA/YrhL